MIWPHSPRWVIAEIKAATSVQCCARSIHSERALRQIPYCATKSDTESSYSNCRNVLENLVCFEHIFKWFDRSKYLYGLSIMLANSCFFVHRFLAQCHRFVLFWPWWCSTRTVSICPRAQGSSASRWRLTDVGLWAAVWLPSWHRLLGRVQIRRQVETDREYRASVPRLRRYFLLIFCGQR